MDTFIRTGTHKASVGFIIPSDPDDCWLWQGSTDTAGYGQAFNHIAQRVDKAHRVIWAWFHGAPPPRSSGLELDHLRCRAGRRLRRRCVNPEHLALVTVAANRATRDLSACRKPIVHGLPTCYSYRRCRCDACRRAWSRYLRERRYARRAAAALEAVLA